MNRDASAAVDGGTSTRVGFEQGTAYQRADIDIFIN
jgi:hypothetical protein